MAPYDSESSDGEEENEYTKTNVVLGFAVSVSPDQVDVISHLGGAPQWIDLATPPSAKLARCKVCNDIMVLLLQLNGDLPDVFPGHERRLYIFECKRKTCRRKEGSVRALRGVRITESIKKENKKVEEKKEEKHTTLAVNIGETLFGAKSTSSNAASANPFAMGSGSAGFANPFSTSSSAASSNPFAAAGLPASDLASKESQAPSSPTSELPKTFASALSLGSPPAQQQPFGPPTPPEPWPQTSDLPKPYPEYYLEDDIEYLEKLPEPSVPTHTMDLDEPSVSGSGGGKEDKDVYESTIDKTFQKFADRLAQNPEQVIRYEFKGQPLLYSRSDAVGKLFAAGAGEGKVRTTGVGLPKCGSCGGRRVFEVQLTPHAIVELEREEVGFDGLEWGTVVVGVCERDCGEKGGGVGEASYVEEWVGVQWEELKR